MNYKEEVLKAYPNAKCVKIRAKCFQIRRYVPIELRITHLTSLSYIQNSKNKAWQSTYDELIIDILYKLKNK